MVERVEDINRIQSSEKINTFRRRKNKRNRDNSSKKVLESFKENELSADELKKELDEKIDDMNKIVDTLEENLSFKLHDDTETLMTQVIDLETNEVIKEMPPEEMLDLAAKIHKMVGLIIDKEV